MAEVIKLRREYKFGAKNIKEIVLDLEELSGQDLVFAEKEYKARNKGATVKELEDSWALTVASKASGIKYGDLLGLKGTDYIKVLNKTKGFLNAGLGSADDTENFVIEETEAQEEEMKKEDQK
jgi:hypothetical protein|nr:MAG TPA: tail assembly chaperone protein [Bacteriophage sp.]